MSATSDHLVEMQYNEQGLLTGNEASTAIGMTFKMALNQVAYEVRLAVIIALMADFLSLFAEEERPKILERYGKHALNAAAMLAAGRAEDDDEDAEDE